jgi:hypothetical protein
VDVGAINERLAYGTISSFRVIQFNAELYEDCSISKVPWVVKLKRSHYNVKFGSFIVMKYHYFSA